MEELKIGQKYIGKLKNEYEGKIIEITERMLDDDESTYHFLHYFGFELFKFPCVVDVETGFVYRFDIGCREHVVVINGIARA